MRKICCFCDVWGAGGIESFLINTFEKMDREDLEIDIVVARLGSEVNLSHLKRMNIGFHQLSGSSRRFFANLRAFRMLLSERGYHVVHLNIYHAVSLLYLLAANKAGVPTRIIHSHGSGLRPSFTRPIKLAIHRFASLLWSSSATNWWACSKNAAMFFYPPAYLDRICIIPNGIPSARFAYNPLMRQDTRQKLHMDKRFIIGHVGRLSSEKNQVFTLEVFVHILHACPEAVLWIVGEGEDREMLEQRAVSLGIMQNICFWGHLNAVDEFMQAMDLLLMPSLSEGLGIVAIEAQAAGLPVLCSDNVPQETNATGSLIYLALSAGPKVWAEFALQTRGRHRQDNSEAILNTGYDSSVTAKLVENGYRE